MNLEDLRYMYTETPPKKVSPEVESDRDVLTIPEYIKYDPEIVGYPDTDMQRDIYNWALEGLNLIGKRVLDVGAGRGDLFPLLSFINDYIGFETKQFLCTAGQSNHGHDRRFNLLCSDYLETELSEKVDVAFVIGTLNSTHSGDKWETFLKFFRKICNDCNDSIIFILNRATEDENFNDFPFDDLFANILSDTKTPFKIDYSRFEDVYKLTVFK